MRFNKLLAVVPFCFAALIGCKPSCEGLCDDMRDEDCKEPFDHDGCMYQCVLMEDLQEDTDKCDDDYDAYLSCVNDQDDICKTQELSDDGEWKKCNSEFEDLQKCFADYCDDHDSRDYCN